jgi:hypothetical protein
MPPPADYRDHPEQWQQGDFPMDIDKLRRALPAYSETFIGDVADAVPPWHFSIGAR